MYGGPVTKCLLKKVHNRNHSKERACRAEHLRDDNDGVEKDIRTVDVNASAIRVPVYASFFYRGSRISFFSVKKHLFGLRHRVIWLCYVIVVDVFRSVLYSVACFTHGEYLIISPRRLGPRLPVYVVKWLSLRLWNVRIITKQILPVNYVTIFCDIPTCINSEWASSAEFCLYTDKC